MIRIFEVEYLNHLVNFTVTLEVLKKHCWRKSCVNWFYVKEMAYSLSDAITFQSSA